MVKSRWLAVLVLLHVSVTSYDTWMIYSLSSTTALSQNIQKWASQLAVLRSYASSVSSLTDSDYRRRAMLLVFLWGTHFLFFESLSCKAVEGFVSKFLNLISHPNKNFLNNQMRRERGNKFQFEVI